MTEAHDRLKALRIKKGFATAADAARAYGWPLTTYQAHENGSRGLKVDSATRYAKAFNSTAAHILTGTSLQTTYVREVVRAPLVGRVAAGVFRSDDSGLEEGGAVPTVPRKGVPAELQYAVLVDGPSVNKRIPDGSYAICAPYDSFPGGAQHGNLVHAIREKAGLYEHTIKELRFTAQGRQLFPVSTDPRFQEICSLDDGEDSVVTIKGVVIGSYRDEA